MLICRRDFRAASSRSETSRGEETTSAKSVSRCRRDSRERRRRERASAATLRPCSRVARGPPRAQPLSSDAPNAPNAPRGSLIRKNVAGARRNHHVLRTPHRHGNPRPRKRPASPRWSRNVPSPPPFPRALVPAHPPATLAIVISSLTDKHSRRVNLIFPSFASLPFHTRMEKEE